MTGLRYWEEAEDQAGSSAEVAIQGRVLAQPFTSLIKTVECAIHVRLYRVAAVFLGSGFWLW